MSLPIACAFATCARTARADATPPEVVVVDPDKRADPSEYRGRENYADAGDVAVWIPRVVFFPVYLLTNYVLRVPLDAFAGWIDRHHVVPIIQDILDPTPDIHWNPAIALDFGAFIALGAEGRLRNVFVRDHEISGGALSSGTDGYRFWLRDSWKAGPMRFGAYGGGAYYQNRNFYGFGPYSVDNSIASYRTYYSDTAFDAFAFQSFEHRQHVAVELSEGFRSDLTGPGWSPSLETVFDPAKVPGFGAQMDLLMTKLDVSLDTRRDVRVPSGGARFEGNVTFAHDVADSERTFVTTAVDATVGAEISRPDRVLSLRGYFADSFALGSEPVPFDYQPMLGFDHHYGFIWGRFRDEAAVMAELRYHHPVAYFLDMEWIASVGNVFKHDLSDFRFDALTSSFSIGLRTRRLNFPLPIELLVGFGTSRFDEPFAIDAVRVYLSTTETL